MTASKTAVPKRRNLSTAIRREQIAQAALEVIAELGVSELSVASVAKKIGLVPSALYRHFQRKDQILDAVLELIGKRLAENVRESRQATANPIDRLRLLLEKHVAMIRQNQVILRVVFSEAVYGQHKTWRKKVLGILEDYLEAIVTITREGQKIGQVRRDCDPRVLAVMFLGLVQPAAILWHITSGRFNLERQVAKAWKIYLRGLAA